MTIRRFISAWLLLSACPAIVFAQPVVAPTPVATVTIASATPAFFNFVNNPGGANPIATLHGGGPALVGEPGLIPGVTFTPAQPNEFVSFFGTGFGPTDPALESGQIPSQALPDSQGLANLVNEVTFTIGGIAVPPADVFYAARRPMLRPDSSSSSCACRPMPRMGILA